MRHAHVSGYHSASREEWHTLMADLARTTSVIAATECRGDVAPFNWRQYRPKDMAGAECSIIYDRDRWQQVLPAFDHRGGLRLTDRTFYTGQGAERPGVVATWALLERQSAEPWTLLPIVAHFPASVQAGDRFSRKVRRVTAWTGALRGLRREVRRLDREVRPDEITVSCDFNVDVTRRRWRAVINHGLRGTGLRLVPPGEPTHGQRAIDAFATTMHRQTVHVLGKFPGFDHRPVAAVLNRKEKS